MKNIMVLYRMKYFDPKVIYIVFKEKEIVFSYDAMERHIVYDSQRIGYSMNLDVEEYEILYSIIKKYILLFNNKSFLKPIILLDTKHNIEDFPQTHKVFFDELFLDLPVKEYWFI